MMADEDEIKEQISFCGDLMDRLVLEYRSKDYRFDASEEMRCKPSRFKQDIIRIRRELLQLSKMIDFRYSFLLKGDVTSSPT